MFILFIRTEVVQVCRFKVEGNQLSAGQGDGNSRGRTWLRSLEPVPTPVYFLRRISSLSCSLGYLVGLTYMPGALKISLDRSRLLLSEQSW